MKEKQVTSAAHGHMLTNAAVWSRDGRRIVYDVRSSVDGSTFDGARIETVDVFTGEVRTLYEAQYEAGCGVATYSPADDAVVFIHGPERPTADWQYGFARRRGVLVHESQPGIAINLDACNLTPPFTAGALRGGSHLHLFSPDGTLVSFTYNDLLVGPDQRNIGVSLLNRRVIVPTTHERNHGGSAFSVLVTKTVEHPQPGSDEIARASEEAWLGPHGKMLAFRGEVIAEDGRRKGEVFIVELAADLTLAGAEPLEGTLDHRPSPPRGTVQRRITRTVAGMAGRRHWLRSSNDGSQIAFLMRDDRGVVQMWTVSPAGEKPRQVSRGNADIGSAFTWSPNGKTIAVAIGGAVGVIDAGDGNWHEIASSGPSPVRPEACVFSPNGEQIAYMRNVDGFNQIFIAS